jgi:hypothetical protein
MGKEFVSNVFFEYGKSQRVYPFHIGTLRAKALHRLIFPRQCLKAPQEILKVTNLSVGTTPEIYKENKCLFYPQGTGSTQPLLGYMRSYLKEK